MVLKLSWVAFAVILTLVLLLALPSCALTGTTKVSGSMDSLKSALGNSGFTLKPAPFLHIDLIRAFDAGRVASASGNNAGAPYRAVMGAVPDSIDLSKVKDLSSMQSQLENWLYGAPGLLPGWQINPDEALVIVMKTPPECTYFSYCGFIWYKYYEQEK